MDTQKALAEHRKRIDELDRRLVELLNERTKIAHEIGHLKKEAGLPVLELSREEKVLANVVELNKGPLTEHALRNVFEAIMKEMRKIQEDPMGPVGPARDHWR
jgi:chorismate mutase